MGFCDRSVAIFNQTLVFKGIYKTGTPPAIGLVQQKQKCAVTQ
jgi:hypothetical protein